MDWKDEELDEGERIMTYPVSPPMDSTHRRETVRAIMTRAVELAAAHGGTMTEVDLDEMARNYEGDGPNHFNIRRLLQHISALGARNAALEAETTDLRERCEDLEARRLAAEDGNRELVRRAQQAESALERETANTRVWLKRCTDAADVLADVLPGQCGTLDLVTKVKHLKERCATLATAGQVLSAHMDKAEATTGECSGDSDCGCPDCSSAVPPEGHDDAATPGHPERVKERSEALVQTIEGDSDDYEEGAEAMRAACWEAIQPKLDALGVDDMTREFFKRAIEGAVP